MIGIDGFGEKVHRAFSHRRHGILDAAVRGHHDNRQLRIELLRRFQDAEAVADRQLEVGKHDGRTRQLELLDSGRLIGRFDDDVALRFERMAQHRAERLFVFDEENGKSWHWLQLSLSPGHSFDLRFCGRIDARHARDRHFDVAASRSGPVRARAHRKHVILQRIAGDPHSDIDL